MQVQALRISSPAVLLSAPVSTATSRSVSSPHALQIPDRIKISPEAREQISRFTPAANAGQTVAFLLEIFRNSRSLQERIQILQTLGATRSPDAVPALAALSRLRLEEPLEKALVLALGQTRQASAVAVLNDLYRSYWNRTPKRLWVIEALGETRSPQALESLRQAYKDAWNSPQTQAAIVVALGQSRRTEAVSLLQQIAQDSWNQPELQLAVIRAYGQTRSEQAAENLVQWFNQHYSQPQIRSEVISALGQSRSQYAISFLQKLYPQMKMEQERQQVLNALQTAFAQGDD